MKKQIIFDFNNTLYNPKSGKLFPGIKRLLRNIQEKCFLVLITTSSPERLLEISNTKISKYFNLIIIIKKKGKAIYQQIAIDKSQTVIIGDRLDEEIAIAKQLGIPFIIINPLIQNPCRTIAQKQLGRLS
jgi:FMN phosphatase YigB (HAD superfamily)